MCGSIRTSYSINNPLELLEQILVLTQQPLYVSQHVLSFQYLLGIHVERLDEFSVGLAVAAEGGQSSLHRVEELTLNS